MKKGFFVFTEKWERIVLHQKRGATAVNLSKCGKCGGMVQWLSLDEAVTVSGENSGRILREIEDGRIHFQETADGHLLICRNSLEELLAGESADFIDCKGD